MDFKNARVIRTHSASTKPFIENTKDETLYKKARHLRFESSFIGTTRNPVQFLEKLGLADGILAWDEDAQAVSAAWMDAARARGGYDYVEFTEDGGMIYREVRDLSDEYGIEQGYENVITSKIVFGKDKKILYGVDYRKGGTVITKDGTKQHYIVPFISIPSEGIISRQGSKILLNPNVE